MGVDQCDRSEMTNGVKVMVQDDLGSNGVKGLGS